MTAACLTIALLAALAVLAWRERCHERERKSLLEMRISSPQTLFIPEPTDGPPQTFDDFEYVGQILTEETAYAEGQHGPRP